MQFLAPSTKRINRLNRLILISLLLFTGCSTLGFGDFDNSTQINSDQQLGDSGSGRIPVKFKYQPLTGGKHQVFLAGDFNNWSPSQTSMEEIDGIYYTTLYLKPGKYGYKFVVDGNWVSDDSAGEHVDDGFGGQNSIIYVGDKTQIDALRMVDFIYKPKSILKEVYLVGSMNDWNLKANRMLESSNGVYSVSLLLKPGEYHYKFLEDGMHWVTDQSTERFVDDGFGGQNSVIVVDDTFDEVVISRGDGVFLDYGIPRWQNLETVNPLSLTKVEFKAKAHLNDVEAVYLIKGDSLIQMPKISEDNTFEYFKEIVVLARENEEFDYIKSLFKKLMRYFKNR